VKGIGHAGAVAKLREAGYEFPRVAGTSAGAIVGAMVAAGMTSTRMKEVMKDLDWRRFRDSSLLDRIPLLGPAASVLFDYGCYEGNYVRDWLGNELAALNVTTFADLRCHDWPGDPDDDQAYKLVVMAADITRGELIRLPWDYRQYGLNPDEQLVIDAVRASISIPLFFEPVTLRDANGESSTLVDGGVVSNYPIDVFDRTDGREPRWPTFGVTLLPRLPAANIQLFPQLGALRRRGFPRFIESLVTTMAVGRDQGYLANRGLRPAPSRSTPPVSAFSSSTSTTPGRTRCTNMVAARPPPSSTSGILRPTRLASEPVIRSRDRRRPLRRSRTS
jgi:NTE family protein